jgi:hypothetical protein
VVLACVVSRPSSAQHQGEHRDFSPGAQDSVAAFVARARAATERYKDQNAAAADGYRRLGPDFPAMGEHWANGEFVIRGEFDASRPGLLTYARIDGVPTLTGVVYALPLADSEVPPPFPFDRSLWHDHIGTIEDESMLMAHSAPHGATGGLRLAVLHAWIWLENPDGTFVTDNWALPYARLGLRAPDSAPSGAARALALVGGAMPYYISLAEKLGSPSDVERQQIVATLAKHQSLIATWWKLRTPSPKTTADDESTLNGMWNALWSEVERSVSADVASRLRRIWQL